MTKYSTQKNVGNKNLSENKIFWFTWFCFSIFPCLQYIMITLLEGHVYDTSQFFFFPFPSVLHLLVPFPSAKDLFSLCLLLHSNV